MDSVVAGPAYQPLPGLAAGLDRFWSVCRAAGLDRFWSVCRAAEASSGLVTDAYIAAMALECACPVATFDRDFRRFDGLTVITPRPDLATVAVKPAWQVAEDPPEK